MKLCRHFRDLARSHPEIKRVGDVGAQDVNGTYRGLFGDFDYVGFDIHAGPNVDVVLTPEVAWQLPGEHCGTFDAVISGQTLEHVAAPWLWIKDVVRLGKPGALIWICAPNTEKFHEYPIDAWRIWPDGMRALFREAGIQEISCFADEADTVGIGRLSR
jgi:hypothetical protein